MFKLRHRSPMRRALGAIAFIACAASAQAADIAPDTRVIARGKVPDESTRLMVLDRLRTLYGANNVDDQIQVGRVAAPPDWADSVQRLIGPSLRSVHRGVLQIDGTKIELNGEVESEAQRRELDEAIVRAPGAAFTVRNAVRVSAAPAPAPQALLDQTLASRTIAFETGSARLTPQGGAILDQMAGALTRLDSGAVQIIGHTDNAGSHRSNLALSAARANAVKDYLIAKGIAAGRLMASGVGPDQPVASNDTEEGRARNRRIEFRFVR